MLLAVAGEEIGDGPVALHHDAIAVAERDAETSGELLADARLARAHRADQDDRARGGHWSADAG
nr:hypothetical protein GCM10025699_52740 [Microbacterium flavescens]